MLTHFGLHNLNPEWEASVVCIGTFDGVHRGHQQVISSAVKAARSMELPCTVVTFDRHPLATVRPADAPTAISTLSQRLKWIEDIGVTACVVLPFDREFSEISAESFLNDVMVEKLRTSLLFVGHDFACGKNREASAEWLAQRLKTEIVPPFQEEGRRISSSEIRSLIEAGDVKSAAGLLGRNYELAGTVISGQKLGRKLGFPTVNLALTEPVLKPADGVYSGYCETQYGTFKAAISIGTRPAVNGESRTVEAYLLDYPGHSLYGDAFGLSFGQRLREERDFESLEALTEQIEKDVVAVRAAP